MTAFAALAASLGACQKPAEPAPAAEPAAPSAPAAPAVAAPAAASPTAPVPAPAAETPAEAPAEASAAAAAPAIDASSLAGKLDAAKAVHGGLLILSDRKGIHAFAPDLSLVAELSPARASHLRVVNAGEDRLLFYVLAAKRQIVRLDLRSGAEKVLATVPRLKNQCFAGATGTGVAPAPAAGDPPKDPTAAAAAETAAAEGAAPAAAPQAAPEAAPLELGEGVNPFDYLQNSADFGVDAASQTACFQISDRNVNMANIILNYRVDLRTGKSSERVVFGDEACQQLVKGKPTTAPLCKVPDAYPEVPQQAGKVWPFAPKAKQFEPDSRSASGRFAFLRDSDVVSEQGDYVYLAPFVFDAQSGAVLTVTPKQLLPVDLAKLRKTKKLPKDTLVTPGEAESFWLGTADVLVLGDGGSAAAPMTIPTSAYYIVALPSSVKTVKGFAATAY